MRLRSLAVLAFLGLPSLLFNAAASEAQPSSFQLVANAANPTSSLSAEEVSKLFLKETTRWPNGVEVLPVDQHPEERAALREAFSQTIHGLSAEAVGERWRRLAFAGEKVPPPEMSSDAAVVEFVKANYGGLGYVSPGTSVTGLRLVEVVYPTTP